MRHAVWANISCMSSVIFVSFQFLRLSRFKVPSSFQDDDSVTVLDEAEMLRLWEETREIIFTIYPTFISVDLYSFTVLTAIFPSMLLCNVLHIFKVQP